MKKTFERSSKLPALQCDLAVLESLINQIVAEFPPEAKKPLVSISVHLSGADLTFESIEEMKVYSDLPASITRVWISISDIIKTVSLGSTRTTSEVTATGPSEAWCAGMVEQVKAFARQHRSWYWFIKIWVILAITLLESIFVPWVVLEGIRTGASSSVKIGLVPIIIFFVISMYLFFFYDKIFKPFVLVVHTKESWVKRHATELTVGAAIISAVSALYTALTK